MIENLEKLEGYAPLFKSLLWIIVLVILVILFRKYLIEIFNLLIERIKRGGSIKAGPIEIGEDLKKLEYVMPKEQDEKIKIGSAGIEREKHRTKIYEESKGIFLTHIITPSEQVGQSYDIFIYLIRHNTKHFNDVEKAEFFFGHMWGNKVFTETQKNGIIGIRTSAYCPFLCTCVIKFTNGEEISISRYIDFETAKICFAGGISTLPNTLLSE